MIDDPTDSLAPRATSAHATADRREAILDSVLGFAIIGMDRDGAIREWNPGATAVFGWTAEEATGQPVGLIFTPEDLAIDRPGEEMRLCLSDGRANDERWHIRKDGARFWASGEMTPLFGADGVHLGFVKVVRDRTSEHEAGEALKEAEERLRRAQEAGGVGLFWVSAADNVIHTTPEFCRLYGMPEASQAPAEAFERLVISDDVELVSNALSRRTGEALLDVEYRIRRADDGALRWIARKGELELDADGRPTRFVGVARDVTNRIMSEQALRDEREQLAQMFAQAPTFMALLRGPEHRFERVNPGYVQLIGHRDVVGRTVAEALPEAVSQGFIELLDRAFATGEPFVADGLKFDVQPSPGGPVHERYLDFVYQPIRDANGVITGIFVEGADVTERTSAAAALRESETRYSALLNTTDIGFCIIQMKFDEADRPVDYMIVEGNAAYERMTGLHGSTGKWVSAIAPGLEQHWFDLYGGVAKSGDKVRFEQPAAQFGCWYDVQAFRIGDPEQNRVAILFNDITARRRTEARQATLLALNDALRDLTDPAEIAHAASEVLGKALGVSRVGYGVIDRVAETITIERDWNAPGVRSIAGVLNFRDYGSYIDDLKAGITVAIADAAEDPRTQGAARQLSAISAESFINMPLVEQGRFVALFFANNATPRPWPDSDLMLMREVAERVRGASERARSEQALRASEAQFRAFAHAVPNHIWASRADGYLDWFNAALHAYTGLTEDDLEGASGWTSIVHPDDLPRASAAWSASLETGTIYEVEFRIRRHDGAWRWFLVRAEPIRDADGVITRWIGASTDIDDRLRQGAELEQLNETLEEQVATRTRELMAAEEALRQSQKMEAVGQLTGGIAHDFNNLLTGITGSLEIMGNRIAQGRFNEIERYTTAAQGAARRAAALTHRLLAFSRRQTLDPRPTDANRLIGGLEELIRRTVGPQVTVEVVAAGGLWTTLVDPNQLENALLNLCINARDAMPEGGRLTIETGNRWLDSRGAEQRDMEPGQYISVCVSDTGTGMSADVIAKAFDPFFTTKPIGVGTGLGLSMIYGFARQSGGQVRIYSEEGDGSMVCIYLPRHLGPAEMAEPEPDLAGAERAKAGETVLIVDDEPTVRMLVLEVLEELGYAALEAADGAAGLKILQSDARIDLLVTDVGLPGGMNGRQMADAARLVRPDLEVLFITGYAENAVVGNGHLDPGMHVMTKPFAMEALASRIKALIPSG
ncbi:PAS domain S-box protein [Brevundimonas sp. PAMC22021]|uniref:PAS domain S-box protein n=1 Tax=Brevundimonas sp. PAMC22021 TaxID=2861285 RepID=UPI001C62C8F4|nr:PAS domain S-box protein [Brevundimonas sp. PAMC22021]